MLFAAEPMIQNPTNIAIDHRGRVWAVEAVDYRISLHKDWEELRPEGDRVVILEDTNGDGAADKEITFFPKPRPARTSWNLRLFRRRAAPRCSSVLRRICGC